MLCCFFGRHPESNVPARGPYIWSPGLICVYDLRFESAPLPGFRVAPWAPEGRTSIETTDAVFGLSPLRSAHSPFWLDAWRAQDTRCSVLVNGGSGIIEVPGEVRAGSGSLYFPGTLIKPESEFTNTTWTCMVVLDVGVGEGRLAKTP